MISASERSCAGSSAQVLAQRREAPRRVAEAPEQLGDVEAQAQVIRGLGRQRELRLAQREEIRGAIGLGEEVSEARQRRGVRRRALDHCLEQHDGAPRLAHRVLGDRRGLVEAHQRRLFPERQVRRADEDPHRRAVRRAPRRATPGC